MALSVEAINLIHFGIESILAGWIAYIHTRDQCAKCKYDFTPKEQKDMIGKAAAVSAACFLIGVTIATAIS